jgi:UDP-glucose 4-epimerase
VRVLVTGGGGFLAHPLTEGLLRDGHTVHLLSRRGRVPGAPKGARIVRGDLLASKGRLVPRGTEVVFHLAALSSVVDSVAHPTETVAVNARGTARLVEEVRAGGTELERFVLASTATVYGPPFAGRLREDHPVLPRNPYSASKLAAESHLRACDALYDIPTTVLRLFNIYGPGQKPSFVVPSVLRQCIGGSELRIGNPWPVRDFVFVADAVRLFRAAAASRRTRGEVLNVGSGRGVRIDDMARLASRVTAAGLAPRSVSGRKRRNDFDRLVADVSKARLLVGWKPEVPLARGLARTADWIRTRAAG